jgi:hypothetical protein
MSVPVNLSWWCEGNEIQLWVSVIGKNVIQGSKKD